MAHFTYSIEDRIATLVLNNPPQNRIGRQAMGELDAALDAVGPSDARVVLLRADGPDFSFGADITTWEYSDVRALRTEFEHSLAVVNRFERLALPVIAAVQGRCLGGGFELVLRADVIFAADSARFGHPEQTQGIVALFGGIYRVAERAGRSRAAEWALTSEQVPASVMAAAGVVNRTVADEALAPEATAFAQKLAKGPTRAYAAYKAPPACLGHRGGRRCG